MTKPVDDPPLVPDWECPTHGPVRLVAFEGGDEWICPVCYDEILAKAHSAKAPKDNVVFTIRHSNKSH